MHGDHKDSRVNSYVDLGSTLIHWFINYPVATDIVDIDRGRRVEGSTSAQKMSTHKETQTQENPIIWLICSLELQIYESNPVMIMNYYYHNDWNMLADQ